MRLRKNGATYGEIAEMYGISRQAVYDRIKKGVPKPFGGDGQGGVLYKNGFSDLGGRDRARLLVRIRDNFTCQDCKAVMTPETAKKQHKKLFDVHHLNGVSERSRGYDDTSDLSGMITLCHKCHGKRHSEINRKKYEK